MSAPTLTRDEAQDRLVAITKDINHALDAFKNDTETTGELLYLLSRTTELFGVITSHYNENVYVANVFSREIRRIDRTVTLMFLALVRKEHTTLIRS